MTFVAPPGVTPVDSAAVAPTTPAAPGFADVLTARTVTLGEMIGLRAGNGRTGAPTAAGTPAAASAGAAVRGGEQVIAAGSRYLGVPYRWGGTDPATGLDCSGLVQRTFADLGVSLPRTSSQQALEGVAVPSLAAARPGDLVYWRGSPNHIGIYAGDNKMLVSPRTGDVVKFQPLENRRPPDAIRRVL